MFGSSTDFRFTDHINLFINLPVAVSCSLGQVSRVFILGIVGGHWLEISFTSDLAIKLECSSNVGQGSSSI